MAETDPNTPSNTTRPSVAIDWEQCLRLLEDSDMTDAQKREFIETVWSIVTAFVDLGFDLHPVQQACGQDPGNEAPTTIDVVALLQASGAQESEPVCPSLLDGKQEKETSE